jgi:carbamoylphosphate synthase large subunit
MGAPARTVVLGGAGSSAAFAAAASLRRRWADQVRIITMDTHPAHLVAASELADVHVEAPLAAAPEFPAFLENALRDSGASAYLPIIPREVCVGAMLAAQWRGDRSIFALLPSLAAARACADKWLLHEELCRLGIPTPRTWLGTAKVPQAMGAVIVKPRAGYGSRGVRETSANDLVQAAGVTDEDVIQERCSGPEVSVDVLRAPDGSGSRALCRERLEVRAGVCTKCRVFEDPELGSLAVAACEGLGLGVLSCIQCMRAGGRWVVTDVNPRPGAGTAMSGVTGNDFFGAAFAAVWGQPWRPIMRSLGESAFVTRQFKEILMRPRPLQESVNAIL